MSCLKIQNFKKKILPKENTQNVNLTCENLPKKLLDEIGTGNVEKIVRVLLTDKNIARYKIKYKPNGNRSERKKRRLVCSCNYHLDTNKQKKSSSKHGN